MTLQLRSFVYAPMSLKGKLIKRHDDDITPIPRFDMTIGNQEPDPLHDDWTEDRYGRISKGHELKAGGRFLYELHDVVIVQDAPHIWHIVMEPGVCAVEAAPWRMRNVMGNEGITLDLEGKGGKVGVNLMRETPVTFHETKPTVMYNHAWEYNYYHKIMDSMPRGWAEEEELIPQPVEWNHRNHMAVRYDKLYFPSFWPASGYAPQPVKWIRNHIKRGHKSEKRMVLFFSRNDAKTRRITNEDELLNIIMKSGLKLTRVEGSKLTFDQQVDLTERASIIVGPHGAAMTNTVFANNAAVIEFVPLGFQHPVYAYISRWAGNWYGRIIASGDKSSDLTVDPEAFATMLKEAQKVVA